VKIRVVIPSNTESGKELAEHFGRAPYFTVVDLDDDGSLIAVNVYPNTGEHSGGMGHAHDNILKYNPHVVIVQGMGPRGIISFQSQNIAVLQANSRSIEDLVKAYSRNELPELTEGCAEAHHR
jgi:predicted Fe-Mo cluster-binding NifX family protein